MNVERTEIDWKENSNQERVFLSSGMCSKLHFKSGTCGGGYEGGWSRDCSKKTFILNFGVCTFKALQIFF